MRVSVPIPIPMYCDNKSAIAVASNFVFHDRVKHIEVDCHITCQAYEKHIISLPYVSSGSHFANFFTKSQTFSQFHHGLSKLSVYNPPCVKGGVKIYLYLSYLFSISLVPHWGE